MDSSGIATFVATKNKLNEVGDSLVLTRPQPNVLRVFKATGLDGWIADWDESWAQEEPGSAGPMTRNLQGPGPDPAKVPITGGSDAGPS